MLSWGGIGLIIVACLLWDVLVDALMEHRALKRQMRQMQKDMERQI